MMNDYWIVGDKVYSTNAVAYVPADDVAYATWVAADNKPTSIDAQQLHAKLIQQWLPAQYLSGIILRSTSNPTLNGIYPLDQRSQKYITYVAAGKRVPGGGDTFLFNGHVFTVTEFLAFAAAAMSYVHDLAQALEQIVMTGNGALPSTMITIS